MPSYFLACEQVGVPSTVIAGDGSVSMQCASGVVQLIEYQPSIFVPLSAADAAQIIGATMLLWGVAWALRLLSNYVSERTNYENS